MKEKNLFQPAPFGRASVTVKNRILMAPMTNCQSEENGQMGEHELKWHEARAKGGFAGAMTACSHVRADAKTYAGEMGCFEDEQINGLKKLSEVWRSENGVSILQIFHGGLRATSKYTGQQPKAPSAIHQDFPGFEIPRALTESQILEIIGDFKKAGLRAKEAGFTGIEIHGTNGYLFTQFFSTVTNQRTDQWGGSLENRSRFLLQTVARLREVLPSPFIIGVRLPAEDSPKAKGFDIDETCQLVQSLAVLGVDYLHFSFPDMKARSWKYPDEQKTCLARIREVLPLEVNLIACGGIKSAADAYFALSEGADFIAVAKSAIADPKWPINVQNPNYCAPSFPLTAAELNDRAVSKNFVEYLRPMKLVAD